MREIERERERNEAGRKYPRGPVGECCMPEGVDGRIERKRSTRDWPTRHFGEPYTSSTSRFASYGYAYLYVYPKQLITNFTLVLQTLFSLDVLIINEKSYSASIPPLNNLRNVEV